MSRLFPTSTFPDTSVPTVNDLEQEINRIEDENLNLKLRIQQLEGEDRGGDWLLNPPGTPAEYLQLMDAGTDSMTEYVQETPKYRAMDASNISFTMASPVARRADAMVVAQEEMGNLRSEVTDLRETSALLLAEVNEKCEEVNQLRRACELLQAREESGQQKIEELQQARQIDREELEATGPPLSVCVLAVSSPRLTNRMLRPASAEISRLRDLIDELRANQTLAEQHNHESETLIASLREEVASLREQLLEASKGRAGDLLRISELEPHSSELTEEVVRLKRENQVCAIRAPQAYYGTTYALHGAWHP